MPSAAPPSPPSTPVWDEFGRPSSGEAQDWTTWVLPLGDGGDALYRSLVIGDGAIAVTIDLHSGGVSGTRTIHRGRCGLPQAPDRIAERVRLLLGAADRAAATAVEAGRREEGATAGHGRPSPRRAPEAFQARRRDGVPAARHEHEERTRERARPEAATAA
jgi:hypothetical protein